MIFRPLAVASCGTLLGLAACGAGSTAAVQSPSPAATPAGRMVGVATITASDMYARVAFLASDALRGRDTPSPGLEAAAAYLADEYRRLGLEPAGGEDGSYIQRYPYSSWALDTATVHFGTVRGGGDNQMLAYGTDFYVSAAAGQKGTGRDMSHASLAYVGRLGERGLPAGSYAGVVPLVTVPGGYTRDWRTTVSRARRAARAAGATALAVVVDPAFPEQTFRQLAAQSRGVQRGLIESGEINVFFLTHRAAEAVAQRAGTSLRRLPEAPQSPVALQGLQAHFAAHVDVADSRGAPNVVAVLRGSDPQLRDEYVVLSSHMDHVGVGAPVDGDSIYNGADDDASGTAALVEVAEALASLPQRPRRSILFLNVSGEEKGLLGSRWYSDHPTVPLQQIVANINVDMIGRNSPDSVAVIGKKYSSLGRVTDQVQARHPELRLTLSDDIWPEERFFFRSDHFNFARKEIPAIFFFSGVHEDYHRPSDEVEKLDTDKAARIARIIFYTAQEVANQAARPTWDPAGLAEVRSLTR